MISIGGYKRGNKKIHVYKEKENAHFNSHNLFSL